MLRKQLSSIFGKMSYISTLSSKGAGLPKQSRFYEDWSSGNHAVNNTFLHRERIRVEKERLKLSARDSVANAIKHLTARLQAPEASYRSTGLTTRRQSARSDLSTQRTNMTTGRIQRTEQEEEAASLAKQMLEAKRQLELEKMIEEEREASKVLDFKLEKITKILRARRAKQERQSKPREIKTVERKRQAYKVLLADPLHHRTRLITARLSGPNTTDNLTARGIKRQKKFLKKNEKVPRILPRRTITEEAFSMAMNPKIRYEKKSW